MGKKKILVIRYNCRLNDNMLDEYARYIHNTLEKYGYIVSDSRVDVFEAEVEGIIWEDE